MRASRHRFRRVALIVATVSMCATAAGWMPAAGAVSGLTTSGRAPLGPATGRIPDAPELPDLTVTVVASGLNNPWDVAFTPDGTLLFDQLRGGLGAVLPSGEVRTLAADFGDNFTGNESGVMGIAIDPEFVRNRFVYICQTLRGPDALAPGTGARNAVIKWQISSDYTSATRVGPILDGLQPVPVAGDPQGGQGRHVGCRLRVDDAGLLYVSLGDGRTPTGPEDVTSPMGKVLRVTLTGAPAPSNPFIENINPVAKSVFTLGHRNPQGLAIDPRTGLVWEVEHGPDIDDEINLLTAGADYGWNPVAADGSYQDNGTPMTRPGAVPAAWSSGDPTIATSGATFLAGSQWGAWDGALAIATLKGVSLHLFSVGTAGSTARAAGSAPAVTESASTVVEPGDVTAADLPGSDGPAAAEPTSVATTVERGTAEPVGTGLSGTFGRLRTAQSGPDGALYLTTSNGNNQDNILRVEAGRRCTSPAGNPTPGGVAAVSTAVGITAFVRGTDDAVWYRRTDRPTGYDTLWGTILYGPAAVSTGTDLLDVFVVGTDNGLYHRSGSTTGPWSGWEGLGGQLTATPAAVSVSPNRIDVFGRGVDGALWTIARIGDSWTRWSKIGGVLASAPGAAADRPSATATVGVRGSDGRLYELQFGSDGPGSAGFRYVGTPMCSAPAYAAQPDRRGTFAAAYRAGDFTLTIGGRPVGGLLRSAPALVSAAEPQFTAFAQGADNALWMYQGNTSTGTWSSLGGTLR